MFFLSCCMSHPSRSLMFFSFLPYRCSFSLMSSMSFSDTPLALAHKSPRSVLLFTPFIISVVVTIITAVSLRGLVSEGHPSSPFFSIPSPTLCIPFPHIPSLTYFWHISCIFLFSISLSPSLVALSNHLIGTYPHMYLQVIPSCFVPLIP